MKEGGGRKAALLTAATWVLLAASPPPDRARHPEWMIGTWVWLNPGERWSPAACNADHNRTYDRHGRYDFMDEGGRWEVRGNRLIETMTVNGGTGDPAYLNKPRPMRIIRVGPGKLRVKAPNAGTMMRCPPR